MAEKHTDETQRDEHAIISGVSGKKVFVVDAGGNVVNSFGGTFSGNVTLAPSPNFIGIVTVANPSSVNFAGNVTINPGPSQIGSVTVSNPISVAGNVTLSDSKGFIGLVTASIGNNVAWADPKGYIGLVTITGALSAAAGNITLDPGSKTGIVGNVTLSDSKGFIGLVTVGNTVTTTLLGNITINSGVITSITNPIALKGNVTIDSGTITTITNPVSIKTNDSVDANNSSTSTLLAGATFTGTGTDTLGYSYVSIYVYSDQSSATNGVKMEFSSDNTNWNDATIDTFIAGNTAPNDGQTYLAPVRARYFRVVYTNGGTNQTTFRLNSVLRVGTLAGDVIPVADVPTSVADHAQLVKSALMGKTTAGGGAWIDVKVNPSGSMLMGFDGNVTINPGPNQIGSVTVSNPISITGNVTLSDPKSFIGLTTSVIGSNVAWADPKGYIGLVTITGALSAAAGNITLDAGSKTGIVGNVTLSDSKGFIGLVTVGNTVSTTFSGNVTLDAGSKTGIIGNVSISSNVAWPDPKTFVGLVTVGNVVSTMFSGNVTLDPGSKTGLVGNITIDSGTITSITNPIAIKGNITITDSKGYIGLVTATLDNSRGISFSGNVTLDPGSKVGLVGNVTIDSGVITSITNPIALKGNVTIDSIANPVAIRGLSTITGGNVTVTPFGQFLNLASLISLASGGYGPFVVDNFGRQILGNAQNYIGLVTVDIGASKGITWSGNVTIDSGVITTITNPVAIKGNMTISDSKGFIGLVTLGGGSAWTDPKTYIGLVTVGHTVTVASHGLIGNLTLDAGSKTGIVGNVTLSDPKTGIGLVSVFGGSINITGNVTISDSKGFIGLVTSVSLNAGTTKTLINAPISFLSAGSQATIAVPTNAQQIYITNMLLNSDATVRISIKSGVTYMSGNASVGITLNPGGGFVMSGSVDSPTWVGLPSGALIIEKLDLTGTSAKIGGNVMYFSQ